LTCLGRALVELDRFHEATDYYRDALRLHDLVDNKWANGSTLTDLGVAYLRQEQFAEAADTLARSIAVHTEAGNLWGEATALAALGDAHHGSGRPDAARGHWRLALNIFETLSAPQAGAVKARLDALPDQEHHASFEGPG
jgi:tetratricopeptide (TPR) repeat protein